MKSNNSNKRISNKIAGILLVFVAVVFIAIAVGVIKDNLYLQDKMDPLKSGSNFNLEDDSSDISLSEDIGINGFVPVAQSCLDVARYHTLPGSIMEIQEGFMEIDDLDEFQFPLCIDPCDPDMATLFNNWYVVYEVYGGYQPSFDPSDTQLFNLYQQDKETGEWVAVRSDSTYIGWGLTWVQIMDETVSVFDPDGAGPHEPFDILFIFEEECCYSYWVAIIDTSCNNEGCINSDQYPTGCEPLTGYIPGKDLKLDLISTWCGCLCSDLQEFVYILVQISRIPNSRINISSPVELAIMIRNTFKIAV